jgi:parallel beta-helix repeat protein
VISGRLASGNQISGNLIGVDASGTAELGNSHGGIEIIGAPNNVVGQSIPGSGGSNTISSNRVGVEIRSAAATGNLIINNKVGTNSSGTAAVANRIGVSIRNGASATSVIGNQISGNSNDGVRIVRADGNRIDANRIGEFLLGNGGDGVDIRGGQGNAIGGNLATASSAAAGPALDLAQGNRIEANAGFGVSVFGDGNSIQINTIGTQARVAERGNQRGGIQILKGSQNAVRENLISGNNGPGVLINGSDANANLVQGNTIGVKDLGGTSLSPLGNSVGVEIRNARDNLIGGSAPNEVNHISGNDKYGIQIHGSATGNHVQGNVIGLGTLSYFFPQLPGPGQPPPTSPLIVTVEVPNGRDGILVEADGNVIGGTAEGAGNVISGNGRNGVLLMGDGNRVQGNEIGTLLTGGTNGSITVAPLLPFTSNGADGVRVHGSNNIIGGSEAGAGNLIAFNAVSGVRVSGGIGNAVVQNSIFDNLGLGIDLGRMGPNENDGPLDADSGANNLQNTPEILRTQKTATHLQIIFYVPSQSPHSTYPIRAEFFVADDDGQEGRTFLSSTEVALPTPAVISIPLADLSPGSQIVATATDADGNTSEFSAPFAADQPSATTSAAAATDLVFQDFGE